MVGNKSYVRFDGSRNKYRVDIGIGGKEFVGRYKTEDEALIAAKAAENAYVHGYRNGVVHE